MSISVVEQGVPLSSVPRARRAPGVDVVRALALVGVCFMNFYGYLITRGGQRAAGLAGQVLDPGVGVLATRFAATFVVVAGMGVSLMARSGGSLSVLRWRLVRRGVLLFTFGFFFNWVWPGTILFFYGAFFVASALLVRLSSKRLATVAGVVATYTEAEYQALKFAEHQARKPYASWVGDFETMTWEAPTPYPQNDNRYRWDESTTSWVEMV